jgi:anaerobic ribonucleoside-triphosphate reductase activating protein
MVNYCGFIEESINEGDGLRSVIFFSGCKHKCKGCHSPQTHDFNAGTPLTEDEINDLIVKLKANPMLTGITLCGGDPFYSCKDVIKFCKVIKKELPHFTIWAYSGFTYEEIMYDPDMKELLSYCDVLIDGPFIEEQKDLTLKFKGSTNQRIIDVKKSSIGNIVLVD